MPKPDFIAYRDSLARLRASGLSDAQIANGLEWLWRGPPLADDLQAIEALMRLAWLIFLGPAARAPGMRVTTPLALSMGALGLDALDELLALAEQPEATSPEQERHVARWSGLRGDAEGALAADSCAIEAHPESVMAWYARACQHVR